MEYCERGPNGGAQGSLAYAERDHANDNDRYLRSVRNGDHALGIGWVARFDYASFTRTLD